MTIAALRPVTWLALAFVLAGCSTTVTSTSGPVNDIRTRTSTETDAARRARVRLDLAAAYFGRGQMKTALDEVKLALEADPRLGAAHNLRGLIHAALGENEQADESFRRALAIDALDIDALQNYGWFLCQRKRYGEAEARFAQALAVPSNPNAARTWLAQGVCQIRAGGLDAAERSLMRAYELDAGNPTIAFHLAEVLLRRGEPERARFYIRRVNSVPARISAQSLWLAVRIEHKLGNRTGVQDLGAQLSSRFHESREAVAFQRGQFDE